MAFLDPQPTPDSFGLNEIWANTFWWGDKIVVLFFLTSLSLLFLSIIGARKTGFFRNPCTFSLASTVAFGASFVALSNVVLCTLGYFRLKTMRSVFSATGPKGYKIHTHQDFYGYFLFWLLMAVVPICIALNSLRLLSSRRKTIRSARA